ncbi:acylneuraminate cytidylyltransferase family protein [Legionella hackeliae]|uniref:CMP-N-acetylneuraminic acid synthetase n=1 Tax=Legionella hackeliae TaxID=449 RepID=A0A0A8UTY9_LEGHA|nr:acylneuraminate cytidylyltransferase family protein [Legionella hackeliae]KTD08796.1 CMP-N-acetlyneuraminic acid synthetase [Legionella hackeliae]CEK10224.1 CMP-N-acetylneuraminic acid synthetase [Legionella hackeliae]STX46953.1 N-acylneuraminate cytidylyltransferase [Legionella hackeliae]
MKTYAFIFARGGSKGLPRKNVKHLAGKPLISYSIEVAKQTAMIERVFVSTDDQEIAQIAAQAGAIVIQRPSELATDTCPEWLAWRHAINFVTNEYGPFELFVSLPPTSPLRNASDVSSAIDLFKNKEADICISITKANRNPFFNMVKRNQEDYCELVNKQATDVSRRQDAIPVFDITTVVYVTTPTFVLNHSSLFEGKVIGLEVPKERAVDIDDIYDFQFAEVLLRAQGANNA